MFSSPWPLANVTLSHPLIWALGSVENGVCRQGSTEVDGLSRNPFVFASHVMQGVYAFSGSRNKRILHFITSIVGCHLYRKRCILSNLMNEAYVVYDPQRQSV